MKPTTSKDKTAVSVVEPVQQAPPLKESSGSHQFDTAIQRLLKMKPDKLETIKK